MNSGTKSWFLQRSYRGSHMQEGKYDVKQHAWSLCHFPFVRCAIYLYCYAVSLLRGEVPLRLCLRYQGNGKKLTQCLVFRQKIIPKETEKNGTRVFQMYLRTQWVKRHAFVTGLKRSRSTRTTGRRKKLFNIVEYIPLFCNIFGSNFIFHDFFVINRSRRIQIENMFLPIMIT